MRTHTCIYIPTNKIDLFPPSGIDFTIYFDDKQIRTHTAKRAQTQMSGFSNFWLKHPELNPKDKIRVDIIKKFEEYRLVVI